MERFIVYLHQLFHYKNKFKIQYGEIYSHHILEKLIGTIIFKIQYGEIYSNENLAFKTWLCNLKSSMERFIGASLLTLIVKD